MAQMKTKNYKTIILISAICIGVILLIFLIFDINNAVNQNLMLYGDNQKILADVMVKSAVNQAQNEGGDFKETIILNIKEQFPTSSSMYCLVAMNDNIIYLKDENTSSTLIDEKISDFFNEKNISSRDKKKYIIAKSELEYNGENYTFVICIKENYLIKKIKLGEMGLHSIGYFVIYGVILLLIIVFSFYKSRSNEKRINALDNQVKNDRLSIEKLENDKNNNYVNSERAGDYSFNSRVIVDEVIELMSEEEKMNCIQIDIIVENLKMEHFVLITAILSRIKEGSSIACYWEENKFKVLSFNSNMQEIQSFIDLFINKYKSESEEKVEELKIVASRLLSKS